MLPVLLNRFYASVRRRPSSLLPLRILALAVLLSLTGSSFGADESAQTDRNEMAQEIMSLMRQDQRAEALPLCRVFNERFPDDQIMLYNQACLENTAGQTEAAAATLALAFAAGFDDFALAFTDPDLVGLEQHPELALLVKKHNEDLARSAADKAITLRWQEKSGSIALAGAEGEPVPGAPTLFVTWTPVGLSVGIQAGEPWSQLVGPGRPAPWDGGPGLIVTLGIPDRDGVPFFETTDHFAFAFGMENDRPVGAVFLPEEIRWMSLPELSPKMRLDDDGNLDLRTMIPWSAIAPFNPLTDSVMGFNAAMRTAGFENNLQSSVLSDPAAFRSTALTRRVVPLIFAADSVEEEILTGKVSGTISGTDPVIIDLVAVSTEQGRGRLTIDFLGGPEQSVLPAGQVTGSSNLAVGVNKLTRQADFSALQTGAYEIKVDLEFPSGSNLAWGATILHLAPGWQEEYLDRIEQLTPREYLTAKFHLDSIVAAVATLAPRRSTVAIIAALDQFDRMLDSAEKTGSILPESGTFLAVYPGSAGENRLCQLYFPAKWHQAGKLNPVLTVAGAPGMAAALAQRMGQNYELGGRMPTLKAGEDEGFPIYCVPLSGYQGADEAAACLAWLQETFSTPTVSVAGIDGAAAGALFLAADDPKAVKYLIIVAGGALDPWPQADIDFLRNQLADFPTTLPVTWIDFTFVTEVSGQGPLILQALTDNGCRIVEVQTVPGGLNFTQVADRIVLWAESLR